MKNQLCKTCNGRGQTRATATIVREVDGRLVTVQQGSGCPACLGTGIVGERNGKAK